MQSLPDTALLAAHLIVFFNPNCTTDIYNNNLIWWTQRDSNPHKLVERGHYPRLSCALENAPGARPLFRSLLLHPQPYGTRHLLCVLIDLLARCTARSSHSFYHQPDYSAPRLTIVLRCGISSPMSPYLIAFKFTFNTYSDRARAHRTTGTCRDHRSFAVASSLQLTYDFLSLNRTTE